MLVYKKWLSLAAWNNLFCYFKIIEPILFVFFEHEATKNNMQLGGIKFTAYFHNYRKYSNGRKCEQYGIQTY